MASPDLQLRRAVVNHIVLPPNVPGSADNNLHEINLDLLSRFQRACEELRALAADHFGRELHLLLRSLHHCRLIHLSQHLDSHHLETAFRSLLEGQTLIIHVHAQNAAVLIRRHMFQDKQCVLFEAFEASPRSADVLKSKDSLQWDFPTSATAIPFAVFDDPAFQSRLAEFLERASVEVIKAFGAHAKKAREKVYEARDTTDPTLITSMLIALLEGIGEQVEVTPTRKRVRDEVRWSSSLIPWRRSPFWLVLRVGVLRNLSASMGLNAAQAVYKTLMCIVHCDLSKDIGTSLGPETSQLLLTKLCRRLAKLEHDQAHMSNDNEVSHVYNILLQSIRPRLLRDTSKASSGIHLAWNTYKSKIRRQVQVLRSRQATPVNLTLSLTNSLPYFAQISHPLSKTALMDKYEMSKEWLEFYRQYQDLTITELRERCPSDNHHVDSFSCEKVVIDLHERIKSYIASAADRYGVGTAERSQMVLTVMWMWMSMDKLLNRLFPELHLYRPVFHPSALDCLRLSAKGDLTSLCELQNYLHRRHSNAAPNGHRTIFDPPKQGCFAEKHYDYLSSDSEMHKLFRSIVDLTARNLQQKEEEWSLKNADHEGLTRQIAAMTCQYTFEGDLLIPEHAEDCRKCFLTRRAERISIERIEKPLPLNEAEAKAVLFELLCPESITAYRNATWHIATTLCLPEVHQSEKEPFTMIHDYYQKLEGTSVHIPSRPRSPVQSTGSAITLGSKWKSFLQTHYRYLHFPVPFEKVCVNNGLKFELYDCSSKTWPAEHLRSITFTHHCTIPIPRVSGFAKIELPSRIVAVASGHSTASKLLAANASITSNEILAQQSSCPQTLGIQEFVAFQGLICDLNQFWPTLLIEFGSSNLNFSSEAVMLMIQSLCARTGPQMAGSHAHDSFFQDPVFCNALAAQINNRLQAICSNWRENFCMEILVSMALKLHELGTTSVQEEALRLLALAQSITIKWIRQLRKNYWSTVNVALSQRISQSILWAALLCKRTFAYWGSSTWTDDSKPSMSEASLSIFIEASISLQDNLPQAAFMLPDSLRMAFIRDLKMMSMLEERLRISLSAHPRALVMGATQAEIVSQRSCRSPMNEMRMLERADGVWAAVQLDADKHMAAQDIEYHLIGGMLLVNGRTVQKELPAKYRNSDVIRQLFPSQRVRVCPSSLYGMTYKLGFLTEGHEIHLGFRQGTPVFRAWTALKLLELVPTSIYQSECSFDLPATLTENCVHWLDIDHKVIEIRKCTAIWKPLAGNWKINLLTKKADRSRKGPLLVDTRSSLFSRLAWTFRGFEDPRHIFIYQPHGGALMVSLPRYDLTFFVNSKGLLESQELRAEIDPDQDAGIWYGLASNVVLRDIHNPRKRSMVVPLGPAKVDRKGMHVEVTIKSEEALYGRFFLDEVLGRVTCATEPRLVYTKALLHALTSFCVPDPLTKKTGTEEACYILQSGGCQPYTPLTAINVQILWAIAALTPVRHYYPADQRHLETVTWNQALMIGMQDDRFMDLVDCIKAKSDLLMKFEVSSKDDASMLAFVEPGSYRNRDDYSPHLVQRSQIRRHGFRRHRKEDCDAGDVQDMIYVPRGSNGFEVQRNHVFQASYLLHHWPEKFPSPQALLLMMQTWPSIGGYGEGTLVYDKLRLSDQLETDIASCWGSLVNLFRLSAREAKYSLLFLASCISFREDLNMHAVQVLIAFAVAKDLKAIDLPSWPRYTQFRPGYAPKPAYLKSLLSTCGKEFSTHPNPMTQRQLKALESERKAYHRTVEAKIEEMATSICSQWPCAQPDLTEFSSSFIDHEKALYLIAPEWHAMFQNYEFEHHLRQLQAILDQHRTVPPSRLEKHPIFDKALIQKRGVRLLDLSFLRRQISTETPVPTNPRAGALMTTSQPDLLASARELKKIIEELPKSRSIVRTEYILGLQESLAALEARHRSEVDQNRFSIPAAPSVDLILMRNEVDRFLHQISFELKKGVPGSDWLECGGLWPAAESRWLLEIISSSSHVHVDPSIKNAIIRLGLLITQWQRLLRAEDAYCQHKPQLAQEELINPGHLNWNPAQYPDWLLLEIESNMLVRPIQAEVAFATISSAAGSNSVLQLNMGQGKTSVIIPLVASVLANSKSLCRIIVPKALLLQTAQLIQSRLGGLLNRELRHLPFSRRTACTRDTLEAFAYIHKDMLKRSGVIIALPEHLMSFLLSGPQRLTDGHLSEAVYMINFQKWLRKTCRDVLDECDFTMAVKTQLIYPSGPQSTVDGARYRWETIEAILKLVQAHLDGLQRSFRSSVQVVNRPQGGYPFVYFLRSDAQDALMERLVADICNGKTSIVKMDGFSVVERKAIKAFLSEARPQKAITNCIATIHKVDPAVGYVLYLVRGLIVHRILLLCLSRRWNVQYGLHPARDPVAVPFHAKGIPSNLAEWGHVDVSLLFTCLSFYYQGLSQDQLRMSLEQILKSDDPAREFEEWSQTSESLSGHYRDWTSLNLEDLSQLEEIWTCVRFNVTAIDYFLNNFVFPKHAKQFQTKLQASGWDLPLRGEGMNITTGFSGTNDNRLILPLTIRQDDLPGLAHTNAEVLIYLLQSRNRGYSLLGRREPSNNQQFLFKRFSEEDFLTKLHYKKIRVLIDSGAAILEMTNHDLVKKWLEIDDSAPAAIYFDENNRAMVTYRGRRTLPLLASPFADDLGDCLVYLDESHTRGTDLKFPPHAHGAVTLSLGQTKDHTVQAVMRLRQLGTTQSVTFFAPPEVHQSIIDFRRKSPYAHIDSHDTICWLLEQTIQGLENLLPLFFAQGSDYCRRSQAMVDYPQFLSNEDERAAYLKVLQDPEQQTLKSMYEPRYEKKGRRHRETQQTTDGKLSSFVTELERHRKAFQDTGNAVHASALQEVEQEREVAVEAETIRERQNPARFHPQTFSGLDDDIRAFVRTGEITPGSLSCQHVFSFLGSTAVGQKYGLNLATNSRFFASLEFRKTVYASSGKYDNFMRPVHYILWSRSSETAILVSPEEAELLWAICRGAAKQSVHLLTYAAPVTRKMLHFNDLKYYAVPSLPVGWSPPAWLQVQLGIFAGRLYFPYRELRHIRDFLGIPDDEGDEGLPGLQELSEMSSADLDDETADQTEFAAFQKHDRGTRSKQTHEQLAKVKAMKFLHAWLALRVKGVDFTQTPMGYVCTGKTLTEDHPFFQTANDDSKQHVHVTARGSRVPVKNDKDVEDDEMSDLDYDDLHDRQKLTEEELKQVTAVEDDGDMFADMEVVPEDNDVESESAA